MQTLNISTFFFYNLFFLFNLIQNPGEDLEYFWAIHLNKSHNKIHPYSILNSDEFCTKQDVLFIIENNQYKGRFINNSFCYILEKEKDRCWVCFENLFIKNKKALHSMEHLIWIKIRMKEEINNYYRILQCFMLSIYFILPYTYKHFFISIFTFILLIGL